MNVFDMNNGMLSLFSQNTASIQSRPGQARSGLENQFGLLESEGSGSFGNLLGLTEDLALVEEQVGDLQAANQKMLSGVISQEWANVDLQRSQAMFAAAMGTPALNALADQKAGPISSEVGVNPTLLESPRVLLGHQKLAGGSNLGNELLLSSSLGLGSEMSRLGSLQGEESISEGAVREWARALVAGDIRNVELIDDVRSPQLDVRFPAAQSLGGLQMADFARVDESRPVKSAKAEAQKASDQNELVADVLGERADGVKDSTLNASSERALSESLRDSPSVADSEKKRQGMEESSRKISQTSNESQSFSDFVMQSEHVPSRNELQVTKPGSVDPALRSEAGLLGGAAGSHSERISPEALNFVADRVERLQRQGGGTLRVEMESQGLGQLDVRVRVQQGLTKVDLRFEDGRSLDLFKTHAHELQKQLGVERSEISMSLGQNSQSLNAMSANAQVETMQNVIDLNVASARHSAPAATELGSLDTLLIREGVRDRGSEGMSQDRGQWNHNGSHGTQRDDLARDSRQESEDKRGRAFQTWIENNERRFVG